ncbi:unnamed protein product [Diamesa tonsa]
MAEQSNQSTISLDKTQIIHGGIFLPESLVRLTLKIAKLFEIRNYDEFSLLDSLQYGLYQYYELNTMSEFNEKELSMLIINIIRLTDKFNNMESNISKVKIDDIFPELQITSNEFNDFEYKVFKAMNFKICKPFIVERIHEIISVHLLKLIDNPEFLFECSLDILRFVYRYRTVIYNVMTTNLEEQDATNLKNDQHLLASSVILVLLKVCNAPEIYFDEIIGILSNKTPAIQKNLNVLSAIIFNMLKE